MAGVFVVAATLAGVIVGMGSRTNGLRASACRDIASQMILVVMMVMMGHVYFSDL
ncbi:MAG: hypothetical protein LC739_13000 [Actinobacteria bacterium]|nr:hypothetical protein [Actinomycetota bacterium]